MIHEWCTQNASSDALYFCHRWTTCYCTCYLFFLLNWRIIASHCCAGFCCTTTCTLPHVQWCPTLWDSINCSQPGFSVHGIFEARILERVAIFYTKASSRPRNWTHVSYVWAQALAGRFFISPLPLELPFCSAPPFHPF